LIRYVRPL
jgi:cytochrome P450